MGTLAACSTVQIRATRQNAPGGQTGSLLTSFALFYPSDRKDSVLTGVDKYY